jgi:hypothetical protein
MKSGSGPVAWQILSKSNGPSFVERNHASTSVKSRLPRPVGTAAYVRKKSFTARSAPAGGAN